MSDSNVLPGWYPVLIGRALRRAAVTLSLAGKKLRIARASDGTPVALDAETGIALEACEAGGWIYVASGTPPSDRPGVPVLTGPSREVLIDGYVRAGLGDTAENILDTTHTSVVHQGYLRRPDSRRAVDAVVTSGENWIAATYPPGAAPAGWGARLLGAHRYTICDTFRAPSISEVTYTDNGAPVFAARFWLTPAQAGETYVAATISVPGRGAVAAVKLAALRLFFKRIFAEDRAILELIGTNRQAHAGGPIVFAPHDLLRAGIEAILAGRRPAPQPRRVSLMV